MSLSLQPGLDEVLTEEGFGAAAAATASPNAVLEPLEIPKEALLNSAGDRDLPHSLATEVRRQSADAIYRAALIFFDAHPASTDAAKAVAIACQELTSRGFSANVIIVPEWAKLGDDGIGTCRQLIWPDREADKIFVMDTRHAFADTGRADSVAGGVRLRINAGAAKHGGLREAAERAAQVQDVPDPESVTVVVEAWLLPRLQFAEKGALVIVPVERPTRLRHTANITPSPQPPPFPAPAS